MWDMYFNAGPMNGYDKYIILDPNEDYFGGFGIYEGSVFIEGNGAVIDLQEGLGIWVSAEFENSNVILDISYVSIINGFEYGVYYSGYAKGQIRNCNFINDYIGLKLLDNTEVNIVNSNFINNEAYGLAVITEIPICNLSYCNGWGNGETYMENCPGWGNIWTQLEPEPGVGNISLNPLFSNLNNSNFSYENNSPCINQGDPQLVDPDGSRSDIGANYYFITILGDCNDDSNVNIVDIVSIIDNCIMNDFAETCNCGDLNEDGDINIVDIVILVNIILND